MVLAKLPLSFIPMPRHAAPTVWVVAEIGVNYDSRLDRAIELVDAAVEAGADAIKLQLFDPRYLLSNQALLTKYQKEQADSAFTMLDKFKLSVDNMLAVRLAARKRKIDFVVTPVSLEHQYALKLLDLDAIKISSADAVNQPLLDMVASVGRPMTSPRGRARCANWATPSAWCVIVRPVDACCSVYRSTRRRSMTLHWGS